VARVSSRRHPHPVGTTFTSSRWRSLDALSFPHSCSRGDAYSRVARVSSLHHPHPVGTTFTSSRWRHLDALASPPPMLPRRRMCQGGKGVFPAPPSEDRCYAPSTAPSMAPLSASSALGHYISGLAASISRLISSTVSSAAIARTTNSSTTPSQAARPVRNSWGVAPVTAVPIAETPMRLKWAA